MMLGVEILLGAFTYCHTVHARREEVACDVNCSRVVYHDVCEVWICL